MAFNYGTNVPLCLDDKQEAMLEKCVFHVELYSLQKNEYDALLWLESKGLVEKEQDTLACTTYIVSQMGRAYLSSKKKQAEEVANKKADEKNRKRTDFLLDILKALIIAALTLAIEHFGDIFRSICTLFSSAPK